MAYVKWTFRILLLALVGSFLHYTLPQRDIVRIVNTYEERQDLTDWTRIFWSSPDDQSANLAGRGERARGVCSFAPSEHVPACLGILTSVLLRAREVASSKVAREKWSPAAHREKWHARERTCIGEHWGATVRAGAPSA